MQNFLIACVRFYQRIFSPFLAPRCRFYPTCSQYTVDAIQIHGASRGSWLALRRLIRCHPGNPGGHDPVPEANYHTGCCQPISNKEH